jgi:membrane-associated protease RseP (regulator of RpoE activity)
LLTLLAITLGLLSITFHELGHYEAMRRCGVRVKEVSLLGIPLPFLPSLYYKTQETVWGIHLFVIGAYVEPEDEDAVETLRLRDRLYVHANGPIVNLVYALVLVTAATVIADIQTGNLPKASIALVTLGGMAWLIWLGRRFIAIALPILTIPILALVGYAIFGTNPIKAVEGGAGGPIAAIASLTRAGSVVDALLLASFLSLNLAVFNLAALPPLDGGRIFGTILKAWLGDRVEEVYNRIAIPFFVVVVVYALGLDGIRIWKWIW